MGCAWYRRNKLGGLYQKQMTSCYRHALLGSSADAWQGRLCLHVCHLTLTPHHLITPPTGRV